MLHCRISYFAQYAPFYQSVLVDCLIIFSFSWHFPLIDNFYMACEASGWDEFQTKMRFDIRTILEIFKRKTLQCRNECHALTFIDVPLINNITITL
jgi:hypothetical protein